MTMNIAIFTPNQNPYSETFIQAHKNGLKDTVFYFYGYGEQMHLEGQARLMPLYLYKAHRVYAKMLKKGKAYLWQQRVLYSLKANKINTVLVEYGNHAHHLKAILKASGLPITVHFHGYDASVSDVIKSCNGYKEVFELATNVLVVSKVMEQRLLALGCPKEILVYNVYGPQKMFETLQPTFAKKQFVAVGRFTDKKAPYYTIMAFKNVLKKHPDTKLLMAGDGYLLNTCENLIKQYQLENSVKFLGVISPEDYSDLLLESLAFVQHSITASNGDMEGTPLAVLEASAAGLPVIATRHAGIPDVIIHEETGLLCEEHDVETMSAHMLQVLDDVNFAKQLGEAGKMHIKTHFSLERHISSLQTVLDPEIEESQP